MQPIQGVGPLLPPSAMSPLAGRQHTAVNGTAFKDMLFSAMERAGNLEQQALRAAESQAAGGIKPGEAASAQHAAETAVHTVTQVRDAMLSALNEIKDLRI